MAKPATLVKDGIAYNYRGERIAPVVAADGYYQDKIPDIGLENGEWMKGVPVPKLKLRIDDSLLVECYTLSDYPALMRADAGGARVNSGRINPALPVGSLIYFFNVYKDEYYYLPPERQVGNLVESIAHWWLRFPFDSPWEINGGKTRLIRTLSAWANSSGCPPMKFVIFQAYRDFMAVPTDLSMAVWPLVERQLGFIKYRLNRQISSMGGVINRILPVWQKGIALCHVWFTINDIDPTNGAGCDVYKNGDFYYGPWCQRIRQKSADNKIMLLHDFPPKYTLRSWIAGPLFSTAQEFGNNRGSNGWPRKFKPTGTTTLLAGTQYSSESDLPKGYISITAEDRDLALERALGVIKNQKSVMVSRALSGAEIESLDNTNDIILRINVWGDTYVRSSDARSWLYCVPMLDKDLVPYELSTEVTDEKWGTFSGESQSRMPDSGCECANCKRIRARVELCLTTKKTLWPEPPILVEIVETTPS